MVVTVSEYQAGGALDDLRQQVKLMNVSGSDRDAGDHSRIADPRMYAESVEGLFEQSVLAESDLTPKARATVSAGEQARWQGHRVADGEGGLVRSNRQKLLPEVFFDLPEVGRLATEGGTVNLTECWKPLTIVPAEVAVKRFVGVESQELPDNLYSEDFGVGEFGSRTALADAPPFEPVVDKAEDGNDEGVKIQEKTSFTLVDLVATERKEVFSFIQVPNETC